MNYHFSVFIQKSKPSRSVVVDAIDYQLVLHPSPLSNRTKALEPPNQPLISALMHTHAETACKRNGEGAPKKRYQQVR